MTCVVTQYIRRLERNDDKLVNLILDNVTFQNKEFHKLLEALTYNTTLTSLSLGKCNLYDEDLNVLLRSLRSNTTLRKLNLMFNEITDSGSNELSKFIKENESLVELKVGFNKINSSGKINMIKALRCNTTIMELMFDLYDKNDPLEHELVEVNKWNRKGGITYRNISELSRSPTNIILLKLILRELPIFEDVHWYILGMMIFFEFVPKVDIKNWNNKGLIY